MKLSFNRTPAKEFEVKLKEPDTRLTIRDTDTMEGIDEIRAGGSEFGVSVVYLRNEEVISYDYIPMSNIVNYHVQRK